MRRFLTLSLLALSLSLGAPVRAQERAPEKPVRIAYYYRVKWGFQAEFEKLFLKNHYPLLLAQKKAGPRIRAVNLYRPTFHGDGRADWTFLVVITFADWAAVGAPSDEEALARKIFPDQDTYKKEEQRRFEILDAHWDVPLTEVEAPQ